jgi:sigma-70-like protein
MERNLAEHLDFEELDEELTEPEHSAAAVEIDLGDGEVETQADDLQVEEPEVPADNAGRRRRRVRAKTISIKRMTKEELRLGRLLYPEMDYEKPTTRAECAVGERPCPFVSCKHHLYIDVNPNTGAIKLNFPDLEVWELAETCALDVADRGGITLEEVGEIMNLTRERVRQVEMRGLMKLKYLDDTEKLKDYSG